MIQKPFYVSSHAAKLDHMAAYISGHPSSRVRNPVVMLMLNKRQVQSGDTVMTRPHCRLG